MDKFVEDNMVLDPILHVEFDLQSPGDVEQWIGGPCGCKTALLLNLHGVKWANLDVYYSRKL